MTKKRMIALFAAAGVILAVVFGVYFYRINLGPTQNEIVSLLTEFTQKIASGDLTGARSLLTEETRSMLRDPGTLLGETVYRNLKLKSVDAVYTESSGEYTADVILTTPDTLKIMTKAGILFGEKVSKSGPVDDPDREMAAIYDEILNREDIPVTDNFCVIRMEMRNGKLYIIADSALQQILEGNSAANVELFRNISDQ